MAENRERIAALHDLIAQRIVIIDGATGTSIQDMNLSAGGLRRSEPRRLQRKSGHARVPTRFASCIADFLAAGADIIETNSFGSTSIVLAEYGLQYDARELNRIAAQLAVAEARAFSTPTHPRFVAGSMGPTTHSISVTGGVTFDELAAPIRSRPKG